MMNPSMNIVQVLMMHIFKSMVKNIPRIHVDTTSSLLTLTQVYHMSTVEYFNSEMFLIVFKCVSTYKAVAYMFPWCIKIAIL